MPRHIANAIELRGGNKSREGREGGISTSDVRPYCFEERKQRYASRKQGHRPGDRLDVGVDIEGTDTVDAF